MLSDLERKRLENRESEDPKIRAVNDARVKKKLIAWLDDATDALEILRNIPSDRLKDDLIDIDVYRLLTIAEDIMRARRFMAIKGESENPDEWEAVGYDTARPVNGTDIGRTILVNEHAEQLEIFVGPKNPVPWARQVFRVLSDPEKSTRWMDRFTPEEKEGVRRVADSEREYVLSLTIDREKESKEEDLPTATGRHVTVGPYPPTQKKEKDIPRH
jgi:hypothetical protein